MYFVLNKILHLFKIKSLIKKIILILNAPHMKGTQAKRIDRKRCSHFYKDII